MDSSEIVKKRLVDLKKLSGELKQSSEQQLPNMNILQAIMSLTKDYGESSKNNSPTRSYNQSKLYTHQDQQIEDQFSPQNSVINQLTSLMSKKSNQSQLKDKEKFNRVYAQQQDQPLFPDNSMQATKAQKMGHPFEILSKLANISRNPNSQSHDTSPRMSMNSRKPSQAIFKSISSPTRRQPNNTANNHINDAQSQIIQLREDNIQLQVQARKLRQQLQAMIQKQKQQEQYRKKQEKNWSNNMPAFKIQNAHLDVFVTRLDLSEKDYHKIDYVNSQVSLALDQITVYMHRSINKSHRNLRKQQDNVWQLSMDELTGVQYLNLNTQGRNKNKEKRHEMQLTFKSPLKIDRNSYEKQEQGSQNQQQHEQFTKTSLFLSFSDQEQFRKWDLALYVNYKIICSLASYHNHQYLFLEEKQQLQQQNMVPQKINEPVTRLKQNQQMMLLVGNSNQSVSDISLSNIPSDNQEYKEVLKDYLEKKQQYHHAQRQLKLKTLQKIHYIKGKKAQNNSQEAEKIRTSKKEQENSAQKQDPKTQKLNSEKKNKEQNDQLEDNQFMAPPESSQKLQKIDDFHQEAIQQKKKQQQQERQRKQKESAEKQEQQKIIRQKQQQEEERRKLIQLEEEIKKKKIEEQKRQQKQDFQWLHNGMLMIKYAKDGYNFHEKKVFIDEKAQLLCWQQRGSTDKPKNIELKLIDQIVQGEIGKGIEKHVGQKNIANKKCYMVIHYKNKDGKVIELGSKNQLLITQFCTKLKRLLARISNKQ